MFKRATRCFQEIRDRLVHIEEKLDRQLSRGPNPDALPGQRYGHLTYSQHGDDMVIVSLLEAMDIERPTYLDIGAHHPVICSNTALLYSRGCRGINVDANPDVLPEFNRLRPHDKNLNVGIAATRQVRDFYRFDRVSGLNSFSSESRDALKFSEQRDADTIKVETITIGDLIIKYANGRYPDFLSIDAEGLDLEILESADFSKSKPSLICVEFLSPKSRDPAPYLDLMHRKGYSFVIRMFANLFFVPAELDERFGITGGDRECT